MATWSGLYNGFYTDGATSGSGVPSAQLYNTVEYNKRLRVTLSKALRTSGGRILGAVLKELTGASVGNTATVTTKRVAADTALQPIMNGGLRTIETKTGINRATTSADETIVDLIATDLASAPTYPTDASGNGGGGKVGGF